MTLETLIEQARILAEQRAFLYDDPRSYLGGIEEVLRALTETRDADLQVPA